ncbi:MAG TPA: ATP-binding cassette domain-containing protein [Bacteroidia bacterium]|nr:ATP-binding cassette domain-containing protein [Bacteroidia bacterium]
MKFELNNVLPRPLSDTPLSDESCWKKRAVIGPEGNYLVEAPSGTGKTTLVSIMYGMRHDYDGDVLLDGKNVRKFSISDWEALRRDLISAVFQDLRLFPQLSAEENIAVKNQLTGALKEDEIRSMAETLGIGNKLGQRCGTLSLGQQQRVAIIRALAQPFRMILLDEPFSHLDEENSRKAAEMISSFCERNKAALVLTSLGPNRFFEFTEKISI